MTRATLLSHRKAPGPVATLLLGGLLALDLAVVPSAGAQETSGLTPPVPQSSTEVAYPEGATGDAVVELELVVEADGTVSTVVVVDGADPFADQARRAALTWTFTPARRAETPVPARIRAQVAFRQPKPPAPLPSSPSAATPSVAPSLPTAAAAGAGVAPTSTAETPLEVTVRGYRHEIGQTTLSAADVREMPGAFGDPFRAVEALPGVAPVVSGMPFFYIRGAPPQQQWVLRRRHSRAASLPRGNRGRRDPPRAPRPRRAVFRSCPGGLRRLRRSDRRGPNARARDGGARPGQPPALRRGRAGGDAGGGRSGERARRRAIRLPGARRRVQAARPAPSPRRRRRGILHGLRHAVPCVDVLRRGARPVLQHGRGTTNHLQHLWRRQTCVDAT